MNDLERLHKVAMRAIERVGRRREQPFALWREALTLYERLHERTVEVGKTQDWWPR